MNNQIANFLFSSSINWVGQIILLIVAVIACVGYYHPSIRPYRTLFFVRLAMFVVAFRFAFAATKTGLQYWGWMQSEFTKFLLPPHQNISVLLHYAWTHFWLNAFISIAGALLFLFILKALAARNPRYFEEGEVELGALMALLAGWPQAVVFVPAVFFSVVLISIVRGVWMREAYTTLGLPFLIGYITSFVLTMYLIALFNLAGLLI